MDNNKKGILFVVSAPSGAGKTSLCKEITKSVSHLQHSISYTTRSPRIGEIDGKDYFFVDKERFTRMVKEDNFLEWAEVHGNLYGTDRDHIMGMINNGVDTILDIDSQGAMQIKKKYKEGIFIYILPPSFDALRTRLLKRKSESDKEIEKRLKRAKLEIMNYKEYYYFIVNDDFNKALRELEAIIITERLKARKKDISSWIQDNFMKE
ncbi:MAG: guanylate kinase [Nitrospirota bacterium]